MSTCLWRALAWPSVTWVSPLTCRSICRCETPGWPSVSHCTLCVYHCCHFCVSMEYYNHINSVQFLNVLHVHNKNWIYIDKELTCVQWERKKWIIIKILIQIFKYSKQIILTNKIKMISFFFSFFLFNSAPHTQFQNNYSEFYKWTEKCIDWSLFIYLLKAYYLFLLFFTISVISTERYKNKTVT